MAGIRFVQVSSDDADDPSSPAAASKLGADLQVLAYAQTHGTNVSIVRGPAAYGPFQHPAAEPAAAIVGALDADAPSPETLPGAWIHADDHSAAVELVLREGTPGEIYALGAHDSRRALGEGLAETVEWYRANRAWWEPIRARTATASAEEQYARRSNRVIHAFLTRLRLPSCRRGPEKLDAPSSPPVRHPHRARLRRGCIRIPGVRPQGRGLGTRRRDEPVRSPRPRAERRRLQEHPRLLLRRRERGPGQPEQDPRAPEGWPAVRDAALVRRLQGRGQEAGGVHRLPGSADRRRQGARDRQGEVRQPRDRHTGHRFPPRGRPSLPRGSQALQPRRKARRRERRRAAGVPLLRRPA